MPSFAELLAARPVLLADGATGTNYQNMGIEPGIAPEEWVFDEPEKVCALHRRFLDAGSDLVLTCTFGATTPRLADGPLAGRGRELNIRAAELARSAAGDDRLVAGSLGPTGQLPEPYGLLTREVCVEAYAEQARALGDGGVEQEPCDRPGPAEQRDRYPDHLARWVVTTTAANPAAMLALAYAMARPAGMRTSSSCIVEKVVSAPQNPVPSSGLR